MSKQIELEAEKYRLSTANKMAIEKTAYIAGYKASKKDTINFAKWCFKKSFRDGTSGKTFEELFEIWQKTNNK